VLLKWRFVCRVQAVTDDMLFDASDTDATEDVTYICDGSESSLSQCQRLTAASLCIVCIPSIYCSSIWINLAL